MAVENGPLMPMTDIHDIKPPENIGFDPTITHYVLSALLGVIILSLLVALFLYWKKRKKKDRVVIPLLTPEEAALQAIEDLVRQTDGDGQAFYFGLSTIFRAYLDGRFGMGSLEMTTEELLPGIDKLNLSRELKREMRHFLNASDPVKFAGYPVQQEQMEKDILLVKNFIRQTTPVSE